MPTTVDIWSNLGTALGTIAFLWAIFDRIFPHHLRTNLEKYSNKFISFIYPYVQITFNETTGSRLKRSEAYSAIQNYLSANSTARAKRLKADVVKGSKSLVLSMDDHEEVTDVFNGVQVRWESNKTVLQSTSFLHPTSQEIRYYKLTFHKRNRELIMDVYLNHVMEEGRLLEVKNRQRKLYTNNPSHEWSGWKQTKWSHVPFEHPATFETLAMEEKKKEEIKKDLIKFKQGKEYYAKIGKAWKRGYLLYGPPGTGKSTMVAAMANFMDYDVYDLELTTVKENTELKKLLIETPNKCIIVIEDIDCSLDLTGQRSKKKGKEEDEKESDSIENKIMTQMEGEKKDSKVTLSGLLNFIDGLWSACGGERIIVFTTNHIDKLDPALIRRGRMDKHIEMPYCTFEAFKVLAYNYLDTKFHNLYFEIERLLKETNMTPADVAEILMPKSDDEDAETCFKNLIEALEIAKTEAIDNVDEEKRRHTEKETTVKEIKENGFVIKEQEV